MIRLSLATLATGLILFARRTLTLVTLWLLAYCLATSLALLTALFGWPVCTFSLTSASEWEKSV